MIKYMYGIFALLLSTSLFSQQLGYMVSGVYTRSIIKTDLNEVETLSDINIGFPSSWIAVYHSVDIHVISDGETHIASSDAHTLSAEQKKLLSEAEMSTDITIVVSYEPKGETGEVREIRNSFTVIPKYEAKFADGRSALDQYIQDHIINKVAQFVTTALTRAEVQFMVDEHGRIADIHVTTSTGNMMMDHIITDALHNMPTWSPAKDANGEKISQKMALSIGNEKGC